MARPVRRVILASALLIGTVAESPDVAGAPEEQSPPCPTQCSCQTSELSAAASALLADDACTDGSGQECGLFLRQLRGERGAPAAAAPQPAGAGASLLGSKDFPWAIKCTSDRSGYVNSSDPSNPVQTACPTGKQCACSAVSAESGEWHCQESEQASPCVNMVHAPAEYPMQHFFASFKTDMFNAAGGSAAIWNTSGWLAFDGTRRRMRQDTSTHVRALSSGSFLQSYAHSKLILPGQHGYTVYDTHAEDTFQGPGTHTCTESSLASFPGQPVAGSAVRFLPADASDSWHSHEDRYLGRQFKDGRACDVWGWTETSGSWPVGGHKVWLDEATGFPVLEEQWLGHRGGYGTWAAVHFWGFEDALSSFEALTNRDSQLFGRSPSCSEAVRSLLQRRAQGPGALQPAGA